MSGNDFADFFPLDPIYTVNEPAIPEVFKDDGELAGAPEFVDLTPQVYKDSGAYKTATEFEGLTPSLFKYSIAVSGGPSAVVSYRMRGYYVGGSTYEFWITSDPNTPNPSGNPLVGKVIDTIISC